jgi:crotonobetainyl-CoA:carnitine CoA-transferase CaiB-like acyl-CoA transferase
VAEVFQEPQAIARGLKIELDHAIAGKIALVASPMRFSGTPITYDRAPPALGQHTDEVLRDTLGMSAVEIARLREDGVV